MLLTFGLDIGTTSIGFAVIEHEVGSGTGKIHRLGVRIFPEARDPKGVPLNQERRRARLRRRQLRRRRERREGLAKLLNEAGLLPSRSASDWDEVMKRDPYELRKRGFEGKSLSPHQVGRALYHLAQRRHFKGRDLDDISDDAGPAGDEAEDKVAASGRERTVQALKRTDETLGAWLARRGPHERKRGEHATRRIVEDEFVRIWQPLIPDAFREPVRDAIFSQRPVFWRLNTLGECPYVPDGALCPRGSWLSQQKRMLEKVNNLSLAGGNQRPLDEEERTAILAQLHTQASMTWPGVRHALAPLYRKRGEAGEEKALKFNLEEGGERKLIGNAIEAKLAAIFGSDWSDHPHKQELRDSIPRDVWRSDYERVADQRVVIRPAAEREARRAEVARRFAAAFDLSSSQAVKIEALKLPTGWEPFSIEALQAMLPHLEAGERFGQIVNGPEWEAWRADTFPNRNRPTGEVVDRLPSPASPEESRRVAGLRNPTVARAQNELRKVVNNLIGAYGKPNQIRVEVTRDVGLSKRRREEKASGIRRQERWRNAARKRLQENGILDSRGNVEKWLLWEECGRRCPYSGDTISLEALFGTGEFEVEHIWPRDRSLDDSFRNKTLCRRDLNARKGNRTPFEFLGDNSEEWAAIARRVEDMKAAKGQHGMSSGKVKKFLARSIPDDFAARQLNDTGFAAREAVAYLKRLWPDTGPLAPVKVFAVSGRVTAHLRKLWGLNNILAEDGEKTRADHRHHAIDALTVSCSHPGVTQQLSRYWQAEDSPSTLSPALPPPWDSIRSDAQEAIANVIVSHRVRKKVSGPLHKETVYGESGQDVPSRGKTPYRSFVKRKAVDELSNKEVEGIVDDGVRSIVRRWIEDHGGDPKTAFKQGYPKRSRRGPEIYRVRLRVRREIDVMAEVSTGYAELGNNHHIAIYRLPDGRIDFEVVSLLEAARRMARKEPVVKRDRGDRARFLMSLSLGDSLELTKASERELRVVTSIWNNGQVVMVDHDDAANATTFRPGPKAIIDNGGRKVSVDPIGRIRPAND